VSNCKYSNNISPHQAGSNALCLVRGILLFVVGICCCFFVFRFCMNYDDLAEEILHLREVQEQTVMDDAAKAAHRERIQELLNFINSKPRTITEFDEALVRKLLESVKVCEFFWSSGLSLV